MSTTTTLPGFINIRSLLLLSFLLRALLPLVAHGVGATPDSFHSDDTASYIRGATSLINEGEFNEYGAPNLHRTPGYCLLLIPGIYFGHLEIITIILQIFLGTLSCFLVWKISLLLYKRQDIALAGTLLFAIEPLSIFYCSVLISETLFATIFLIFSYYLIKYFLHNKWSYLIIFSVVLSFSVYVRPISYYLPLALMFMIAGQAFYLKTKRTISILQSITCVVVCATLVGAWQVRNFVLTGYSEFCDITAINLYWEYGNAIKAEKKGITYKRMTVNEFEKEFTTINPNEISKIKRLKYMKREGLRIIMDNPIITLKIGLLGLVRTLTDLGTTGYLRLLNENRISLSKIISRSNENGIIKYLNLLKKVPNVVAAKMFFFLLMISYWVLTVFGVLDKGVDKVGMILLIILALYLVGISMGPYSYSRFRTPIMPYLCIFGGAGYFILKVLTADMLKKLA
jgi:hypothetical protein